MSEMYKGSFADEWKKKDIAIALDGLRYDDRRKEASDDLVEIGEDALEPLFELLQTVNLQAEEQMETEETYKWIDITFFKFGERAKDFLLAKTQSENEEDRQTAASALGSMRDDWCVEPLLMLLNDNDQQVRQSTVWALGIVGEPRTFTALEEYNRVAPHIVRQALFRIKDVQTLIETATRHDSEKQRIVATSLELFGNIDSLPVLRWLSKNAIEPDVQEAAADAIEVVKMRYLKEL
jgi:hypothetical protein